MITRSDVEQTLLAAEPMSSPEDVELLWQTISTTMQQRTKAFYETLRENYRREHGQAPDPDSDERIRNRAAMDAENSVRGQYLEELTILAGQNQLEQEEQEEQEAAQRHLEALLQDPDSWKGEDWVDVPRSEEADWLTEELWEDESSTFQLIAGRRIALAYEQRTEYPKEPGPLAERWRAEIRQATEQFENQRAARNAPH